MGKASVYFVGTCRNGWFADVGDFGADVLAASLLRVNGGGAWAVWAADEDAPSDDLPALAASVLHGALVDGLTLGDALVRGKAGVLNPDVPSVFHLFGDPSSRLVPASRLGQFPPQETSVSTGCSTAGSTGVAYFP
jgi:hypothetical protein